MWFKEMLRDQNGNNSSKRFVAFIAFIQVLIMANRETFGKNVDIDKDIWWGMVALVCTGLGLAIFEFFSNLPKGKK